MDRETRLFALLHARDTQAFETVVRQYGPRMFTVAHRLLRHGEDSADAVQDALLAAYRSIESFEGNSKLWTWLYRILVNACLTMRRSRYRRRLLSLDALARGAAECGCRALSGLHSTEPVHTALERAESQAQSATASSASPRVTARSFSFAISKNSTSSTLHSGWAPRGARSKPDCIVHGRRCGPSCSLQLLAADPIRQSRVFPEIGNNRPKQTV